MTETQAQPTARQKQHRERVGANARVGRPTRGGPLTGFLVGLMVLVCMGGLLAAVVLTVYLGLAWWQPRLLPTTAVIEDGLFQNLLTGAVFFWLELGAIVGLLRLYDDFRLRARNKAQLFDIHDHLVSTINEIEEMRYAFAVKLDESRDDNGLYSASFNEPNRNLRVFRDRFLLAEFSDPEVTHYAQAVVARVLRILDRMIEESYWAIEDAVKANAAKELDALEVALNRIFDITDPNIQGLVNLAAVLDEARDG